LIVGDFILSRTATRAEPAKLSAFTWTDTGYELQVGWNLEEKCKRNGAATDLSGMHGEQVATLPSYTCPSALNDDNCTIVLLQTLDLYTGKHYSDGSEEYIRFVQFTKVAKLHASDW
jgi:hypothetical protein